MSTPPPTVGPRIPPLAAAWLAGVLVVLATPLAASAHRPPTGAEFRAVARSVDRATHHFYCPVPGAVDVSTRDPRWAAAFGVSNCGSGSIETRFYLRRASRRASEWEVVVSTSSRGIGVGSGPPCGPRTVPADVRCGVRGRS
jgi:hypothetical protein